MLELNEEEQAVVALVNEWVDREVRPQVHDLDESNTHPDELFEQMKKMGIFGLAIPEPWNDASVSVPAYVAVGEALARGWMTLSGLFGGHNAVADLLVNYGTQEQKDRYLPKMATGEIRVALGLTEPGGGSDLQAMRTSARLDGDEYVVNGSKTWITNAQRAHLTVLLVKTDMTAVPGHRGISILLIEKGPGFEISRSLGKLGYRGIDSCELSFEGFRTPRASLLGGEEGRGFAQMMGILELGRIMVASCAVGVGQAALDDAVRYSQERESFGKPIWQHQLVGANIADMATRLAAARQLTAYAARCYENGERSDLEAGMAKLFASETAMSVALDAIRVHGGYGYSTEYDVQRYFRDAPLMIVGEGANEIQKNIIARQLIERAPVR